MYFSNRESDAFASSMKRKTEACPVNNEQFKTKYERRNGFRYFLYLSFSLSFTPFSFVRRSNSRECPSVCKLMKICFKSYPSLYADLLLLVLVLTNRILVAMVYFVYVVCALCLLVYKFFLFELMF